MEGADVAGTHLDHDGVASVAGDLDQCVARVVAGVVAVSFGLCGAAVLDDVHGVTATVRSNVEGVNDSVGWVIRLVRRVARV